MKPDTDPIARPRQERSRRTRADLLAAVERVVAAEGPEAVTTTRIAAETGVSVGTLYRYFADREALLLAAYDETVGRIIAACHSGLSELPEDTDAPRAACILLRSYLDAADAIPAHSGLLSAMRIARPVATDFIANRSEIERRILAPFFARFLPQVEVPAAAFPMVNTTIGALVDLYLVTEETSQRDWLRVEAEAYLTFVVARLSESAPAAA
ncbi:MAG: TetR/AcrR family transcriptional regulator [Rhizobiaceae bacterium]|nr:TetR/AcrR family transcriptional regulator [Rhizobiaceae bacterium]